MSLWSALRDARYALPGWIERHSDGPDAGAAARIGATLAAKGIAATYGYFPRNNATPDEVLAANLALMEAVAGGAYVALKAPHMGFDALRHDRLAQAAAKAGVPILFDAHAPAQADATLALVARFAGAGCVIPARWRRSMADAERLKDGAGRIRVVKGEWPDPDGDPADSVAAYMALVGTLAGRRAPVAVATHDPALARRALGLLLASGTPCELEQLRGLPQKRCAAVARELGVPLRVYIPFGPGWWPYAVDKALARPYLPLWALRDSLGLAG